MTTLKRNFVFSSCIFLIITIFSFVIPDTHPLSFTTKLSKYSSKYGQEKIYIHCDRQTYAPGDTIWYRAYLVNAINHLPDTSKRIIYIELLDPSKKILATQIIKSTKGIAKGDFNLTDSLPSGTYGLRAYTPYMKNFDQDFLFFKNILILSPYETRQSQTQNSNSIDLQFFPEGGSFLANINNMIAFKAINEFGHGVEVEGEILDNNNSIIASFKSTHKGMGKLNLKPLKGANYTAKIKNHPTLYRLPKVEDEGFIISTAEDPKNVIVTIKANSKIGETKGFALVAHSRGQPTYEANIPLRGDSTTVVIAKTVFPTGIATFTLFGPNQIPFAERLFFINHRDQLNIQLKSFKTSVNNREKFELLLSVQDVMGNPVQDNFSIAVYDAKLKTQEKYPSNIVSHLLLNSDLKGNIEDPGYYFEDTSALAKHNLDLVMMTHGWRRFTWKEILSDSLSALKYRKEDVLTIKGTLQKVFGKKLAPMRGIKVVAPNHDIINTSSDLVGNFNIRLPDFYDSATVAVQTEDPDGKASNLKLNVESNEPPLMASLKFYPLSNPSKLDTFFTAAKEKIQIEKAHKFNKGDIVLQEVVVEADKTKEENERRNMFSPYGSPDIRVDMANVTAHYPSILDALPARVPGVIVYYTNPPPTAHARLARFGGGEVLYVLNGIVVEPSSLSGINAADVDYVDVLNGPKAAVYGSRGGNGVILIYTKRGKGQEDPTYGMNKIKMAGLHMGREFYSPQYNDPAEGIQKPDFRSTLYWNPTASTNSYGKALIPFFTSDLSSKYEVLVEGISKKGVPGKASMIFEVK